MLARKSIVHAYFRSANTVFRASGGQSCTFSIVFWEVAETYGMPLHRAALVSRHSFRVAHSDVTVALTPGPTIMSLIPSILSAITTLLDVSPAHEQPALNIALSQRNFDQTVNSTNISDINMRLYIFTLLVALFFTCALAIKNQKPILVTYPSDTPQSVIDEAIATLKKAGGIVTHEYSKFT